MLRAPAEPGARAEDRAARSTAPVARRYFTLPEKEGSAGFTRTEHVPEHAADQRTLHRWKDRRAEDHRLAGAHDPRRSADSRGRSRIPVVRRGAGRYWRP